MSKSARRSRIGGTAGTRTSIQGCRFEPSDRVAKPVSSILAFNAVQPAGMEVEIRVENRDCARPSPTSRPAPTPAPLPGSSADSIDDDPAGVQSAHSDKRPASRRSYRRRRRRPRSPGQLHGGDDLCSTTTMARLFVIRKNYDGQFHAPRNSWRDTSLASALPQYADSSI